MMWLVTGLLVAWYVARVWTGGGKSGTTSIDPPSIDYRGTPVRVSRPYGSYEEYKDDPNNIAPGENAKVTKLVGEAPIQKRFASRKEMVHAVFALKFPGYGLSSLDEARQPDGSVLSMHAIEIPRADRHRFIVFRGTGEGYVLVDDFIAAANPRISKVREENGKLAYYDRAGKLILSHPFDNQ